MGRRIDRRHDKAPAQWRSEDGRVTILASELGGATVQVSLGGSYMGTELTPADLVEVLSFFKDVTHFDPIHHNYQRSILSHYTPRHNPPAPEGETL